jgi:catechol 2,3-dioxygenase-like lactoylglutathione lyase family enzyme
MTRLVQVALRATDLDRAAAFYTDLLGLVGFEPSAG